MPPADEPIDRAISISAGETSRLRRRPAVVLRAPAVQERTAIFCGAEEEIDFDNIREDDYDESPWVPQVLPEAAPRSAVRKRPRTKRSSGCGAAVHGAVSMMRQSWVGTEEGRSATVVPLPALYHPPALYEMPEMRGATGTGLGAGEEDHLCACVSRGVGCAICGNALGVAMAFCAEHSRLPTSLSGYIFIPSAVTAATSTSMAQLSTGAPPQAPPWHATAARARDRPSRRAAQPADDLPHPHPGVATVTPAVLSILPVGLPQPPPPRRRRTLRTPGSVERYINGDGADEAAAGLIDGLVLFARAGGDGDGDGDGDGGARADADADAGGAVSFPADLLRTRDQDRGTGWVRGDPNYAWPWETEEQGQALSQAWQRAWREMQTGVPPWADSAGNNLVSGAQAQTEGRALVFPTSPNTGGGDGAGGAPPFVPVSPEVESGVGRAIERGDTPEADSALELDGGLDMSIVDAGEEVHRRLRVARDYLLAAHAVRAQSTDAFASASDTPRVSSALDEARARRLAGALSDVQVQLARVRERVGSVVVSEGGGPAVAGPAREPAPAPTTTTAAATTSGSGTDSDADPESTPTPPAQQLPMPGGRDVDHADTPTAAALVADIRAVVRDQTALLGRVTGLLGGLDAAVAEAEAIGDRDAARRNRSRNTPAAAAVVVRARDALARAERAVREARAVGTRAHALLGETNADAGAGAGAVADRDGEGEDDKQPRRRRVFFER